MKLRLLALALTALPLAGCGSYDTYRGPIASHLVNKEGTLVVVFRNTGKQVASFDYTIADRSTVPHVDADGPQSGLVENLYPGDQKEVPNPSGRPLVYPKIGRVTFGKRTNDELAQIYRPTTAQPTGVIGEPSLMPASSGSDMPTQGGRLNGPG